MVEAFGRSYPLLHNPFSSCSPFCSTYGMLNPTVRLQRYHWLRQLFEPQVVRVDEDDDDDDLPLARAFRPRTLGSDQTSPTALQTLGVLHIATVGQRMQSFPDVTASVWHGSLYVAVYWHPAERCVTEFALPALQRNEWHTTLCVGYFPPGTPVITKTLTAAALQPLLEAMWGGLVLRAGHDPNEAHVLLTPPPWPRSWNFSVGEPHRTWCTLIRGAAEAYMTARNMTLREPRPIHVSWR